MPEVDDAEASPSVQQRGVEGAETAPGGETGSAGGEEEAEKGARLMPWWGWLLTIVGLGLAAVLTWILWRLLLAVEAMFKE